MLPSMETWLLHHYFAECLSYGDIKHVQSFNVLFSPHLVLLTYVYFSASHFLPYCLLCSQWLNELLVRMLEEKMKYTAAELLLGLW